MDRLRNGPASIAFESERLHEAAASAGIAPRAFIWDESAGVQVREFLDGRVWTERDVENAAQLQRLGERLAHLHSLKAPHATVPFDPGACALQYLRSIESAGASTALATAIASAVRGAAEIVAATGGRAAIVHGDLAHANLIDAGPDGHRLMLLDWEYAQVADPLYDVACMLAYYDTARPHASVLLQAAGLGAENADRRLSEAVRVYEGLTWLWHRARGTGVRAR